MKKRVMALLLAASLAATAFAGCGSSKDTGKSNDTKAKTESQSEVKIHQKMQHLERQMMASMLM